MAAPVLCDGPDQGPALFMITNLAEAETVALCAGCAAGFCEAYLSAAKSVSDGAATPGTTPKTRPARPRKPDAKAGPAAAT